MPNEDNNEDVRGNGNGNRNRNNGGSSSARSLAVGYNLTESQKLIGSSNYQTWKFLMKGVLINDGGWEYVTGIVTNYNAEANDRTFYKIVMNVASNVIQVLLNQTSAKDAWNRLEALYGGKNVSSRVQLMQDMFSSRLENFNTMDEYITHDMTIQEKLAATKKGLDDEIVASVLLIGLSEEYKPLRMTLETLHCDLTSDLVRTKLLTCQVFAENSALYAKSKGRGHNGRKFKCHFCNEEGHFKYQCRKFKKSQKDAEQEKGKDSNSNNGEHKM